MATIVDITDRRGEQWGEALRNLSKSIVGQMERADTLAERAKDRAMRQAALDLQTNSYRQSKKMQDQQHKLSKLQIQQVEKHPAALAAYERLMRDHYGLQRLEYGYDEQLVSSATEVSGENIPRSWSIGEPSTSLKDDEALVRGHTDTYIEYLNKVKGWKAERNKTLGTLQRLELAPKDGPLHQYLARLKGVPWDGLDENAKLEIASGSSGAEIEKLLAAQLKNANEPLTTAQIKLSTDTYGALAYFGLGNTFRSTYDRRPTAVEIRYTRAHKVLQNQLPADADSSTTLKGLAAMMHGMTSEDGVTLTNAGGQKQLADGLIYDLVTYQQMNHIVIPNAKGVINKISIKLGGILKRYNADKDDPEKKLSPYGKLIDVLVTPGASTMVTIGEGEKERVIDASDLLLQGLLKETGFGGNAWDIASGKPITFPTVAARAAEAKVAATETPALAVTSLDKIPEVVAQVEDSTSLGSLVSGSETDTGISLDGIPNESAKLSSSKYITDNFYTKKNKETKLGVHLRTGGPTVGEQSTTEAPSGIALSDVRQTSIGNSWQQRVFQSHVRKRVSANIMSKLEGIHKDPAMLIEAIATPGRDGFLEVLNRSKMDPNDLDWVMFIKKGGFAEELSMTQGKKSIVTEMEELYDLVHLNYKSLQGSNQSNNAAMAELRSAFMFYIGQFRSNK